MLILHAITVAQGLGLPYQRNSWNCTGAEYGLKACMEKEAHSHLRCPLQGMSMRMDLNLSGGSHEDILQVDRRLKRCGL